MWAHLKSFQHPSLWSSLPQCPEQSSLSLSQLSLRTAANLSEENTAELSIGECVRIANKVSVQRHTGLTGKAVVLNITAFILKGFSPLYSMHDVIRLAQVPSLCENRKQTQATMYEELTLILCSMPKAAQVLVFITSSLLVPTQTCLKCFFLLTSESCRLSVNIYVNCELSLAHHQKRHWSAMQCIHHKMIFTKWITKFKNIMLTTYSHSPSHYCNIP